jgi:hypothetical protein
MKKMSLLRTLAAWSAAAALLAGCGGGGGGGEAPPFGRSVDFENICTLDAQKKFVRAYLDEVYLWYDEIPAVDPALYNNIPDYFNALLVKTPDASGLPRDRFSAVLLASQADSLLQQSLAPVLKAHTDAVPITNVFTTTGGRKVGYILFNDHDFGAQDDLITAFRQIQPQGVQDLVLDLRNNSGGFLYVAATAASMITGPASEGRVFEQLRYNKKRTEDSAASTLRFSSRVQFEDTSRQYPVGTELPQLSLPRVFVITTGRTCSASESIINSLRGIGVQVIRIGTTTCGKPYGFRQKNNCNYAFFPIEFQGTNALGFGDYTTGFQPMCNIAENRTVAAGSADDPLLNGAKFYIDNNSCPAGTATGVQSAAAPKMSLDPAEQPTRPAWAGRLLLPQQQPR